VTRTDAAGIEAAAGAARAVASGFGVGRGPAEVLRAGANVVVRLSPEPVVARVAHWTALVRPTPAAALGREVAMASWLASRGVAVVAPSGLVPPGPHRSAHGHVLTFWTEAAGAADTLDVAVTAGALAALHDALADYPGELPAGPGEFAADAVAAVDVAARAGLLDAGQAARLATGAELAEALPASGRALHGDPHPRNLLTTAGGEVLWNDFEDAFRGPLEWDLAVMRRTAALDGEAALAAYLALTGVRPDAGLLAACGRVRDWQALCWTLLGAVHHPRRVSAAQAFLTRWLAV
jgi:hypothetical protein